MRTLRRGSCLLLIAVIILSGPADAGVFGDFSLQEEVELGKAMNLLVRSHYDVLDDPQVSDYVRQVVERIEDGLPAQPFPIQVTVLQNESMNAFAAPAGFVFIHTGLLLHLQNEDQLAGVLAHELAHVTQRHIARNIERSQLINLGTIAGMLTGVFLGGSEGSQALALGSIAGGAAATLKYSREDEREADQIGTQYMRQAGYPISGMLQAFEIMRKRKWLSGHSQPTYLSTHPGISERIAALEERIDNGQEVRSPNLDFERTKVLIRARYTQDPAQALANLREQEPAQDPGLLSLGEAIALERLHRIQEAGSAFEQALAHAAKDPLIQREAGRFYFLQGQISKALSLLSSSLQSSDQDTITLFWYAKALAEAGQRSKAILNLERLLRLDRHNARACAFLGRLKGQAGDLFKAHLYLAYAAVYQGKTGELPFHLEKVESLADTEQEEDALKELRKEINRRKELKALVS